MSILNHRHVLPFRSESDTRMLRNAAKFAAVLLLLQVPSFATTVFSSTFADPNNVGSIGGGLFTGSASDVNINQGPWKGTYSGIFGVLAPPVVSVNLGSASIGGVAGVNLLGIVDNYGWLFRDTGLSYHPNSLYTLTVDVDAGGLLTTNLLSTDGVGIGLTTGGDTLLGASTNLSAPINLQLLSGSLYRLSFQLATGNSAPAGNIGIRLFDQPTNLATANLLAGVTFSNVSLDESSAVPEPLSLVLVGTALLTLGLPRSRRRGRQ